MVKVGYVVSHLQTEVKIDMRHPSVNGTMSQFLYVKIKAIIFVILMFFMLMFVTQQLIYSYICSRNSSTKCKGWSSVFLVNRSSPKTELRFLKVGENFYYKREIHYRKTALPPQIGGCNVVLDFHFFHIWEDAK